MIEHRRSSSYSYGSSREGASHHTSSAFSASAQPDEDWTKISDLAERRRIQNRIAQRNYRESFGRTTDLPTDNATGKKLKKRLEDLEKKAASTSPSPEQTSAELPIKTEKGKSRSPTMRRRASPAPLQHSNSSTSEDWSMFSNQHTRQMSTSPPPHSFQFSEPFTSAMSPPLPSSTVSYLPNPVLDYNSESLQYSGYQQMYDGPLHSSWQDKSRQDSILESGMPPMSMSGYMPMSTMDSYSSIPGHDSNYTDAAFTDASLVR